MDRDFSKEVFSENEQIKLFLDELKTFNINKDVYISMNLLREIDFKHYYVLIENLINELQIIVVSKSDADYTITAVFRNNGYHKFYVGGCKFHFEGFKKQSLSEVFRKILEGQYKERTLLKSGKVIEKQISILNVCKKIKIGWFNIFTKFDSLIEKDGFSVLKTGSVSN